MTLIYLCTRSISITQSVGVIHDRYDIIDLFGNRLLDCPYRIPKAIRHECFLRNQAQKVSKYLSYRTGLMNF